MTKYILAYHGGSQPASKEEGEKTMAAWTSWIGANQKSMIDVGNPTGASKLVAPGGKISDGGGSNAVTGYSIVEAGSLDDAVAMTKSCPQLAAGGTVEVAELMTVM